jgi:hypothetical protein
VLLVIHVELLELPAGTTVGIAGATGADNEEELWTGVAPVDMSVEVTVMAPSTVVVVIGADAGAADAGADAGAGGAGELSAARGKPAAAH